MSTPDLSNISRPIVENSLRILDLFRQRVMGTAYVPWNGKGCAVCDAPLMTIGDRDGVCRKHQPHKDASMPVFDGNCNVMVWNQESIKALLEA